MRLPIGKVCLALWLVYPSVVLAQATPGLWSSPIQATFTYYVDNSGDGLGSDANNGTAASTPFLNITALPTITTGQSVGLAYGSHWRQELSIGTCCGTGIPAVTVSGYKTNYNSTNLPILDASDVLPNANFVKTSGHTNVYNTNASVTFTSGCGVITTCDGWANLFETGGSGDSATGTFLINETGASDSIALALVDSTACSYYIPGMTTTGNTGALPFTGLIYIHSCDSSSPITNGYTYEYSNRPQALQMTGAGGSVSNVEGRKAGAVNGEFYLGGDGKAYTVNGIIARDGVNYNATISGGSTITGSTFINANWGAAASVVASLIIYDNVGSGLPFTVSNSFFQYDQVTLPGQGILNQVNSGSMGAATISGNWFIAKNGVNMTAISSLVSLSAITISGNYGSQLNTFANDLEANTTLSGNQSVSTYSGGQGQIPVSHAVTLTLTSNKFCEANGNYIVFASAAATFVSSFNLYYVQTPNTGFDAAFASNVNGATLSSNHDDFGTGLLSGNYSPIAVKFNTGWSYSGGNNIYENANVAPNWYWNSSTPITSLATWESTTGDTGSTESGGNAVTACTLPTIPTVN